MSEDDLVDRIEHQFGALDLRNQTNAELLDLFDLFEQEAFWEIVRVYAREEDDAETIRLRIALQRLELAVVEEMKVAEFSVRAAERLMIGGGLAAIVGGVIAAFSADPAFLSLIPILSGAYAVWRGHRHGLKNARRVAYCQQLLALAERAAKMEQR